MKFSFSDQQKLTTSGFTLIEMVTVIGIFVVVTGIILANLPSFRSSSALDLVAQEVATQVRGAQIYAMSTVVSDTTGNVFGYLLQTSWIGHKDFKLCACKTLNVYDLCVNSCHARSPSSLEDDNAKYIESYLLGGKVEFGAGEVNLYFKRPMGSLYCGGGSCDPSFSIKVTDKVNSRWIIVGSSGSISITDKAPLIPI
ncbi:MAG: hypothetical protein A2556_00245 [Candidatus Vogelbacteria bacterium RIFOXYD2_FULL_44_9]|uniref:General secretion pathway GspH domain-containing protein n=1 Tax=Candidatus Vogelbacteria bacterium RIFOXYD2_FULL_44_9 TaxID=1802441 RepID=A0A1G2QJK1_9BACT|nr:MAG: hypothetical protein A2556_00245 [Candidatus Vogelbacteria bacterium RIFOXYD2_FULL_44_9]